MKKQTTMDTARLQARLEKELQTLEAELKSVGHKNPDNPKDWEPGAGQVDVNATDLADIADNIESYESNTAILKPLEKQWGDVKLALDKIKKGSYGVCEVCKAPIESERLEANPSARTCLAHKEANI